MYVLQDEGDAQRPELKLSEDVAVATGAPSRQSNGKKIHVDGAWWTEVALSCIGNAL